MKPGPRGVRVNLFFSIFITFSHVNTFTNVIFILYLFLIYYIQDEEDNEEENVEFDPFENLNSSNTKVPSSFGIFFFISFSFSFFFTNIIR